MELSNSEFIEKLYEVSDLEELVNLYEENNFDWYRVNGEIDKDRSLSEKKVLAYSDAKRRWWNENRVYDSYQRVREPVSTHLNFDDSDLYVHGFIPDTFRNPVSEEVKSFLRNWTDKYLRDCNEIYVDDSLTSLFDKSQKESDRFIELDVKDKMKDFNLVDYYVSNLYRLTKSPIRRVVMFKEGIKKRNHLYNFTSKVAKNKEEHGIDKDLLSAWENARNDKDWHFDLYNAIRSYTLPFDLEKDFDKFMDNENYMLRDKRSEFIAESFFEQNHNSDNLRLMVDFENEPLVVDYINDSKNQ